MYFWPLWGHFCLGMCFYWDKYHACMFYFFIALWAWRNFSIKWSKRQGLKGRKHIDSTWLPPTAWLPFALSRRRYQLSDSCAWGDLWNLSISVCSCLRRWSVTVKPCDRLKSIERSCVRMSCKSCIQCTTWEGFWISSPKEWTLHCEMTSSWSRWLNEIWINFLQHFDG